MAEPQPKRLRIAILEKKKLPETTTTTTTTTLAASQSYTACHAALDTNELLCNIIQHLPFKDIVTATGVSHTWREAIKTNDNIQRELYLSPLVNIKTWSSEVSVVGAIHPLLHDLFQNGGSFLFNHQGSAAWINTLRRLHDRGGPWRDMYLVQPPVTHLKPTLEINDHRDRLSDVGYIDLKGVRIGGFLDFLARTLRDAKFARSVVSRASGRRPHKRAYARGRFYKFKILRLQAGTSISTAERSRTRKSDGLVCTSLSAIPRVRGLVTSQFP